MAFSESREPRLTFTKGTLEGISRDAKLRKGDLTSRIRAAILSFPAYRKYSAYEKTELARAVKSFMEKETAKTSLDIDALTPDAIAHEQAQPADAYDAEAEEQVRKLLSY